MPTFYITGLYHTEQFNDRTLPPLKIEAVDHLEALVSIGVTVWTEEQWIDYTERARNDPRAPKTPEPIWAR